MIIDRIPPHDEGTNEHADWCECSECLPCEALAEKGQPDFDTGANATVQGDYPADAPVFPSREMLEIIDPDSLDYSRGVKIIKDKDGNLHFRPATERKMDNE